MKIPSYKLISKTYNQARPIDSKDLKFWSNLVQKYIDIKSTTQILDLGCGNGRFSIYFSNEFNCKVTGIDISKDMIDLSIKNDRNRNVNFFVDNAKKISIPSNSIDLVWISHLIHLIDNPDEIMEECLRVMKKGSIIINRHATSKDNLDRLEINYFPTLKYIYSKHFLSKSDMLRLFNNSGFEILTYKKISLKVYRNITKRFRKTGTKSESSIARLSNLEFENGINKYRRDLKILNSNPKNLRENYSVLIAKKV